MESDLYLRITPSDGVASSKSHEIKNNNYIKEKILKWENSRNFLNVSNISVRETTESLA